MRRFILFVGLLFTFISFVNVNAEEITKAVVNYNDLNMRLGPGVNYSIIKTLAINASYSLADANLYKDEKGCKSGWYKIEYSKDKYGYVCSSYIDLVKKNEEESTSENECETALKEAGFPKSYWSGLCSLKEKYPNWNFEADITGLDFATSVQKESVVGKSLIQTPNQGYLSLDSGSYDYLTDTFKVREGSNWYAANKDVVAYYMDPRNFFTERYIFMFEKLSYDASYQTKDAVSSVLKGRDIVSEVDVIMSSSEIYNINAIYLASKIRQETGGNYTNYSLAGNKITVNNKTYDHIYNPYNIGANTGAHDGLVWAASGSTYLRPWINIPTAIQGGASHISATYIGKGQDSTYFQKFNTSSYSSYSAYAHQYMSNIRGASSEASISYDGYNSMELLLDTAFTFVIPVYENMKDAYNLPTTGNPNNHLSNLTINDTSVLNFSHDNYEYTYYISKDDFKVNIKATPINQNATIEGVGEIEINSDEVIHKVKVIAQNENVQEYTIRIVKTDGIEISLEDIINSQDLAITDNYITFGAGYTVEKFQDLFSKYSNSVKVTFNKTGNLFTSDVVTFEKGEEKKEYTIVIMGDANSDGNINIQDLLKVQKHIIGYSTIGGSQIKASDTNHDGVVDILDLLRIQKHILGYLTIS